MIHSLSSSEPKTTKEKQFFHFLYFSRTYQLLIICIAEKTKNRITQYTVYLIQIFNHI